MLTNNFLNGPMKINSLKSFRIGFQLSHIGKAENVEEKNFEKPLVRVVRVFYGDHPNLPSVSIYFQGCDVLPKCIGCHNPETWDFDNSYQIDLLYLLEKVNEKLTFLLTKYEKVALALIGGEPLSEKNRRSSYLIAKTIKEHFEDRVTTIVYSWRTPKQLLNINISLDYFDEFVLGKYKAEYRTDRFPASKNQLYINKKKLNVLLATLKKGAKKSFKNNLKRVDSTGKWGEVHV
ncbi:MAG: 4Fe-4S cluster-binding domain-containing protein [Fervidobacterium sp.]